MSPEEIKDGLFLTGFGLVTAFGGLGLLFLIVTINRLIVSRIKPGESHLVPQPGHEVYPIGESTDAKQRAAAVAVAVALDLQESRQKGDRILQAGDRWRIYGLRETMRTTQPQAGWRRQRI